MTRWTEGQFAELMERRGNPPPFKLPANEAGAFALGRLPRNKMNNTEVDYASYLEQQRMAGEILWWRYEGIKLKLADNTFLTPDFFVMTKLRSLEVHETKGFWRDDARVKIKVAASIYPFRFIAVKKKGGGWEREEFS